MHYPPARRRIPPKHKPLRLHFTNPAPGVFGVDIGEAMFQQMVREFLRENGLRGEV